MEQFFSGIGMFAVFLLILYILWKVYGYYQSEDAAEFGAKDDKEEEDEDI